MNISLTRHLTRPAGGSRRIVAVMAVAPLLLLGACAGNNALSKSSGSESSGGAGGGGGNVVIGGQNYTEMQVMSQIYKQLLENAGYTVTLKLVESRDVYAPQMEKGNVDISADYLSSMTEYLNQQENGPDAKPVASHNEQATLAELKKLAAPKGLEPLQPAAAQDANAFAVTKKFAQQNKVSTMSDLAALGKPVTLAAAEDCSQRQDCKLGLERVYGLKITKVEPLGFGTQQTKDALKSGEVTLGQVGTSDATLGKLGLVLLKDDKALQNAENLVPMANADFIKQHPDVAKVLDKLSAQLTTSDLATMIGKVDLERQLPEDVAKQYLTDKGLL